MSSNKNPSFSESSEESSQQQQRAFKKPGQNLGDEPRTRLAQTKESGNQIPSDESGLEQPNSGQWRDDSEQEDEGDSPREAAGRDRSIEEDDDELEAEDAPEKGL